jgi:uncharacterized delta-60 repeat protein
VLLPLAAPGSFMDYTFTVRNPGGAPLEGLALSIDGPDAAEFSLALPPAASVAPGVSTVFTLRHTPASGANKSAVLHLASSVAGARNPFDLTLQMQRYVPDLSFTSRREEVETIAVQPDGKVLVGTFSGGVRRFRPDGSPDPGFFAPFMDAGILCMAVQRDGRILAGGYFNTVNGLSRKALVRLHPDGSVDESFDAGVEMVVEKMVLQPDGKIILGGVLFLIADQIYWSLARISPDGARDLSFQPPNVRPWAMALQPDGKVLITGTFSSLAGAPADRIARLNPDGSPDAFPALPLAILSNLTVVPDGRIIGAHGAGVTAFYPDGTTAFSLPIGITGSGNTLAVQADGKIIAAFGSSATFGGELRPSGMGRLNPDGTLDASFNPPGWPGAINCRRVTLQADGRMVLTGTFPEMTPEGPTTFGRLHNDAALSTLTREGTSTLKWMRSGSAPEVSDVVFEIDTPAGTGWTPLGAAARIPGGWELSGLALPPAGRVRALGRTGPSLHSEILSLSPENPLVSWRRQYFNTAANTGDAADDADPDKDGITNFTEFAFGLNPVDRTSNALPEFKHDGNRFTAAFTVPDEREEMHYSAEWSPDMRPGSWTPVPDTGAGRDHVFSAPGNGGRIFVRYSVAGK